MNPNVFECALSGLQVEGVAPDVHSEEDGELPIGWTRVTMTRRVYNQQWLLVQQAKEQMVNGILAQLPPEARERQELLVRIQIDAQYAALEASLPRYGHDVEDVVYVSDAGDAVESLNEVRSMLGLDVMPALEDEDEDDEEVEEALAEGSPPQVTADTQGGEG